MKHLTLGLFLVAGIVTTNASAAIDIVTRCDYCTDPALFARNQAGDLSKAGVTVFVGDFGHDIAFLYFVIDDTTRNPQKEPIDYIAELYAAVKSPIILDSEDFIDKQGEVITKVIQIEIPQREQEHFEDYVWYENYLSSQGIDTSFDNVRPSAKDRKGD